MTLLERAGQAAIFQVEEAGALSMQFWSVLRKLPRVLPIVGVKGAGVVPSSKCSRSEPALSP